MSDFALESLPTPAIVIDGAVVRRNLRRMAEYAAGHGLKLRPHTKTHKSRTIGRLQMEHGAVGLTVAKPGEASVMADVADDVLLAYPAVDAGRAKRIAEWARGKTIRIAVDSATAVDVMSAAAQSAGATVGVLVDLDVGLHRTGVQSPADALALARHVSGKPGLRLDGLLFYPGHIWQKPGDQDAILQGIDALLGETIGLWAKSGLAAPIVSGGSTPSAFQSHQIKHLTEIRPGTYVFNDTNTLAGGFGVTVDDCAARIVCTVMSDAVPGQIVIDAGSKTLAADRCHPAPDSGHGIVVELPGAKITKLSEEHGQIDVHACGEHAHGEHARGGHARGGHDWSGRIPSVGERVTVIPNHICPCVNLQDRVYWNENGDIRPLDVDARGRVY